MNIESTRVSLLLSLSYGRITDLVPQAVQGKAGRGEGEAGRGAMLVLAGGKQEGLFKQASHRQGEQARRAH